MNKPADFLHPQRPSHIYDALYGRARGDSLIALGTMKSTINNPDPHPSAFVPIINRERQQMLPLFQEHLADKTHYIMPNTLKPSAAQGVSRIVGKSNGKEVIGKYFLTQSKYAQELVAITIDLDVGRGSKDLSAAQALSLVFYKTILGEMPTPSIAAYSGRGAYLLYLLKEDDSPAPPLATPDNIHKWKLCCGEIVKRTEELESDPSCKGLLHWFKAPGSITGKENTPKTIYMTFGVNDVDAIPLYTLDNMSTALNLQHSLTSDEVGAKYLDQVKEIAAADFIENTTEPEQEQVAAIAKTVNPDKPTKKEKPKKKRRVRVGQGGQPFIKRAREIDQIANHRGGIKKGLRHMTLVYYYNNLVTYYRKLHEIETARQIARDKAKEFNASLCKPPMLPSQLGACFQSEKLKFSNTTLAEHFKITRREVEKLELKSIIPQELSEERKAKEAADKQTAKAKREDQAELIKKLLLEGAKQTEIAALLGVSKQYIHAQKLKLQAEADAKQISLFDKQ